MYGTLLMAVAVIDNISLKYHCLFLNLFLVVSLKLLQKKIKDDGILCRWMIHHTEYKESDISCVHQIF